MSKRQPSFAHYSWVSVALLAGALLLHCGGRSVSAESGGETHFLQSCVSSCGGGFDCVRGVCTEGCIIGEPSCTGLPGNVSCTDASVEPGSVAICDVACTNDIACSAVSDAHSCVAGFCRAPNTKAKETGDGSKIPSVGGAGGGGGEFTVFGGAGGEFGGGRAGILIGGAAGETFTVGGAAGGPAFSCECVAETISWGVQGDPVETPNSMLISCANFAHGYLSDWEANPNCAVDLCSTSARDVALVSQISATLAQPEVQAALAAAPAVYGVDAGTTGAMFQLDVGGKRIAIGAPCPAADKQCVPVPPQLTTLRVTLSLLQQGALEYEPCGTTFGVGDVRSCNERLYGSNAELNTTLATVDRACLSVEDCQLPSLATECAAACDNVPMSNAGAAVLASTIAGLNENYCARYEAVCGPVLELPCAPPGELACVTGQCVVLE